MLSLTTSTLSTTPSSTHTIGSFHAGAGGYADVKGNCCSNLKIEVPSDDYMTKPSRVNSKEVSDEKITSSMGSSQLCSPI